MFVTEKKSQRRREEDTRSIIEDKEDEKCCKSFRKRFQKRAEKNVKKKLPWRKEEKENIVYASNGKIKNRTAQEHQWKIVSGALRVKQLTFKWYNKKTKKETELLDKYKNERMLLNGLSGIERKKAIRNRMAQKLQEEKEKYHSVADNLFYLRVDEERVKLMKKTNGRRGFLNENEKTKVWDDIMEDFRTDLESWKLPKEEMVKIENEGEQALIDCWASMKGCKERTKELKTEQKEKQYLRKQERKREKSKTENCTYCNMRMDYQTTESLEHLYLVCPAGEKIRKNLDDKIKAIGDKYGLKIFPPHRKELRLSEEEKKTFLGKGSDEYNPLWSFYGGLPIELKDQILKKMNNREEKGGKVIREIQNTIAVFGCLLFQNRDRNEAMLWEEKKEEEEKNRRRRRFRLPDPEREPG